MQKRLVAGVALICGLQLFMILTPLIPATSSFWHKDDPVTFNGVLAAVVSAEVTLAILLGQLTLTMTNSDLRKAVQKSLDRIPPARIARRTPQEFYTEFLTAATLAKRSVRIAYLANYPPETVGFDYKKAYYRRMAQLMKSRRDITFRRLIRESDLNRSWAAELIRRFQGRPNNSIAFHNDGAGSEEMPFALSVQVVDEKFAWIVAAETHEAEKEFRDLVIENADAGESLTRYYDRLWAKSQVLLENGNLTPAGAALIHDKTP